MELAAAWRALDQGHLEAVYTATTAIGGDGNAEQFAIRAFTKRELGHVSDALADANLALTLSGAAVVAAVHGLCAYDVGDLRGAWESLERAQASAGHPLTVELQATLLEEHEQRDEALRCVGNGIKDNPFSNRLRLARAGLLCDDDPQRGLRDVDLVLTRSPEHVQAMILAGLLGVRCSGNATGHLFVVDRAVALAPHSGQALNARAILRTLADDIPGARADALAAVRLTDAAADSLNVAAVVGLVRGDIASARTALEALPSAPPSLVADAWATYARLVANAYPAEARYGVKRALSARPHHHEALSVRALLCYLEDDIEGALRDSNAVLARDADDPTALGVQAAVAFVRDDPRAGLDKAERALRREPESGMPLCISGLCSAFLGDLQQAKARLLELRRLHEDAYADVLQQAIDALLASQAKSARRSAYASNTEAVRSALNLFSAARAAFGA